MEACARLRDGWYFLLGAFLRDQGGVSGTTWEEMSAKSSTVVPAKAGTHNHRVAL
jgi:hypothetical protein